MTQSYKKIAITGANSFLGTNVVRELSSRGVKLNAIVRRSNSTIDSTEGCTIFKGNVLDLNDLCAAAQGCDAIVHIAAITEQSLLKYDDYKAFNVQAVEVVIAAARALGIKRVVIVSSSNAVGNGTSTHLGDETTPINGPYIDQLYGRSKVEAEKILRQATDLDGIIVNPCFMLGEFDSKPSSGTIILHGYGKRLIFTPPGGKNFVDVAAAATAIANAVERGKKGENYLLAGVNLSITDFMKLLCCESGKRSIIIIVPKFALMIAGYFGDLMRFMGIKTQVSSTNMRVICTREYYSGAKAERELGLPKTDLPATIHRAVQWFKKEGKIL